jgi:hypothetical protein
MRYQRTTAKQVLKQMQLSEMLATNYDFPKTDESFQEFVKAREETFPTYKPPITMNFIEMWKRDKQRL